jgi:hypothetical protein
MTVFDGTYPIITRSGTMRPQDVADGQCLAIMHLVASGHAEESQAQGMAADLRGARDAFVGNLEAEGTDGFDIESASASHESLAWTIEAAVSWITERTPEGWVYEVNENDPAEAGFYRYDNGHRWVSWPSGRSRCDNCLTWTENDEELSRANAWDCEKA